MTPPRSNRLAEQLGLLLRFVRPYQRQFLPIAILSLLATGADLLAPIVYREAVNDIAGLFVGRPGSTGMDKLIRSMDEAVEESVKPLPAELSRTRRHERGHLAPRTADQVLATLLWSVVILLGINVSSHFAYLVADQRTVRLASRVEADVIQKTFSHVLNLPLGFFSRRSSGSLAKQIDQSDEVAPVVTAMAQQVMPELMSMVGILVIMMTQSWTLTLAALVTFPPYLWIVLQSSERLETGLASYYEMWDRVSGRIQDVLGAAKTVKLSGAEKRERERLQKDSNAAYDIFVERNRLTNRYLFWQNSLSYLSEAIVLGYGGWLVFQHRLTPGDVVMFVAYLDKLYSPIETLTSLGVTMQEHLSSLARAARLLDAPGEEKAGKPLPPGPGLVELRNVNFGYVEGRQVLHDVSFTLAPGKITGLVGPSGAGKTTIADLLLRLFDPQGGTILLDGAPLSGVGIAELRREVGVVAADGAIFAGSLLDNIRYKRPDATEAEVRVSALAAGLGRTLERLPNGLLTEVGEGGIGLSVGERQRLQIARAIVGRPRVLILDEATANLDYATEAEIRGSLFGRAEHPTTLVIAHRYSMIASADHVVVLDAGTVVDQGTPAELVARGGWFASFAAATVVTSAGVPAAGADASTGTGADDGSSEDDGEAADEDNDQDEARAR